ncbi:MAG: hydroxymethylglutaryl-CoA synthase [Deltaproteobacteria bacterium]|nr:hydroxymethylglutaryl-CoA synthase [Deltaproteobacteria bacterium]
MKAGIESYGAYVPIYRLSREEIFRVWGSGFRKGEKAVANSDEDSLTMGVAAAVDCLEGLDYREIDGLYFASTSAPYREKKSASIIASALDLRRDVFTADFADSLGSGASALRAALDAVNAGSANKVLIIASDCRLPAPKSAFEPMLGDGAAALIIGKDNIIAEIKGFHTISSDFLDIWRKEKGDRYIRAWEDRFIIDKGYASHLKEAVTGLLKRMELAQKDITKAAFYGPDPRSHKSMIRKLGFEQGQVQDPMFDVLGNTGAAFFLMITIAALEKSKTGDRILAASYGDGADALLFHVTDGIDSSRNKRGIEKHLKSKMMLDSYGKYLRFRDLMEWESTPTPPPESSENVFYREGKALLRGYGHKCRECGHVQFPPQRICMWCQTKDQFDEVRIIDKKGRLFTFSLDDRAVFTLDLPNVLGIVDLKEGGRIYNQVTDRDPGKLEIGMEMEFTFRRFHEGSGFHNYSWKLQPVRC